MKARLLFVLSWPLVLPNVSLLYSAIDPKNNDLGNKKVKIVQPINSLPYCHIKGPVLVEGCILGGAGFEPFFYSVSAALYKQRYTQEM